MNHLLSCLCNHCFLSAYMRDNEEMIQRWDLHRTNPQPWHGIEKYVRNVNTLAPHWVGASHSIPMHEKEHILVGQLSDVLLTWMTDNGVDKSHVTLTDCSLTGRRGSTTILFDYWEGAESSGRETNYSLVVHLEMSSDASGNVLY